MSHKILFVDAYDSFTRNIVALLYDCVANVRITTIHIDTNIKQEFETEVELFLSSFDAVILGPGPGDPQNDVDVGLFKTVWEEAERHKIPVLGICLGFQSLCLNYGMLVTRMREPCHGQTKLVRSNVLDIFENVSDVVSMNYNSLCVRMSEWQNKDHKCALNDPGTDSGYSSDSSADQPVGPGQYGSKNSLLLLAWDDEGYAMAVRHTSLPFWGFQFHPESCMSNSSCHQLIRNWWSRTMHHNMINRSSVRRKIHLSTRLDSKSSKHRRSSPRSLPRKDSEISGMASHGRDCANLQWVVLEKSYLTMDDLSSYCHKSNTESTAILESSAKGRYCIYAFIDDTTEKVSYSSGQSVRIKGGLTRSMRVLSPIEALEALEDTTKAYKITEGNPDIPFWGGYVGYISYEMCLDILHEVTSQISGPNQRIVPDFNFVFVTRSIVLDKKTGNIYIQSIQRDDGAWIETTQAQLLNLDPTTNHPKSLPFQNPDNLKQVLSSTSINLPNHSSYQSQIQTCQSDLYAGNSYELCLTTEATATTPVSDPDTPYLLYRNLNRHNPVPFASYLHFPGFCSHLSNIPSTTILSTSPEQFLSWSRTGTLDMVPMKGTVPRITPSAPSLAEATAILRTPKESAENLMIADLIRHDLYGVVGCQPATRDTTNPNTANLLSSPTPTPTPTPTVEIIKLNEITPYATVYQLTSHIRANPPASLDPQDVSAVIAHNHSSLRHTLPPGSMTGAPKRRSCQILRDIEQRNRGVYSGIIGYMDVGGGGSWSVAIRTAWSSGAEDFEVPSTVASSSSNAGVTGASERVNTDVGVDKFQKWHVGAGGAITVLSDVDGEWNEMMGKLRSVLKGFRS